MNCKVAEGVTELFKDITNILKKFGRISTLLIINNGENVLVNN